MSDIYEDYEEACRDHDAALKRAEAAEARLPLLERVYQAAKAVEDHRKSRIPGRWEQRAEGVIEWQRRMAELQGEVMQALSAVEAARSER